METTISPVDALAELRAKKEKAITDKVADIVKKLSASTRGITTVSTCNTPYHGWDVQEHLIMPTVAERLRSEGLQVISMVNFGVTDYTISV